MQVLKKDGRFGYLIVAFVAIFCFTALLPEMAMGQLIGGDKVMPPYIATFNVGVDYNASTGVLTASGSPEAYLAPGGAEYDIFSTPESTFSLTATLSQPSASSPMVANGTFSFFGSLSYGSPELLMEGTVDENRRPLPSGLCSHF